MAVIEIDVITGERTAEGFYKVRNGVEPCIARAKAYAPHADLIWMETGTPDLELARKFAEAEIEKLYASVRQRNEEAHRLREQIANSDIGSYRFVQPTSS